MRPAPPPGGAGLTRVGRGCYGEAVHEFPSVLDALGDRVSTPAPIVLVDVVDENIRRMQDFADLHGLLLKVMDHSVIALTDCRIGFVDHAALRRLSADHPHLWRLFTLLLTIDASIQRTWLVSIGRRNPASHLAHLICETHLRLFSVGRAKPDEFELPIGQADLADLLGLSVVHTNRTLQELRAQNLVRWRGGTVHLPDRKALAALAEFDPIYLHLDPERR